MKKEGFISVKDKKLRHWSKYYQYVYVLNIDFESFYNHGKLRGWTLSSTQETYTGNTKEYFFEVLQEIKKKLDLQYTGNSDDVVVIYIDKLSKVKGFFGEAITNSFEGITLTLFDVFEVRSYTPWTEDPSEMQEIVDKIFIPEKYFYLTPNQRMRKKIERTRSEVIEEVYPDSYLDYKLIRQGLFGGICFCPYPGMIVNKPMISIDLKSAYIFSLLIEKHCMSKRIKVDPATFEYYLNNEYETSLGLYKIKYCASSSIIYTYKDTHGNQLEKGEQEVKIVLTSVDLKLLMKMEGFFIKEIECVYLEKYDLDHLPKPLMDILIEEYIKKDTLVKDSVEYKLQKATLNGIYGNSIKTINDKTDFASQKNKSGLCPQWGIWTTSYTKKLLLGLARNLSGWVYSDTDSIYCADTPENRELIYHYNMQTQCRIRDFCDQYGYDFEALKELGNFEVEYEIKKFRALKRKEYLFTTKDDNIVVKAAGCNKEEMPLDDSLYEVNQLPVGTRTFSYCDDGYYERKLDGEVAALEMMVRNVLTK